MRRRVVRVEPKAAGSNIELQERGEAVAVVRGGWPGTRLFFDVPTESTLGANSIECTDGAVVAQSFDRLFVVFGDLVAPQVIELEVYSCAPPVVPLLSRGSAIEHRHLKAQAGLLLEEPPTLPGYNPVPILTLERTALENAVDRKVWHRFPELFLGGGFTSTLAMRAHLWALVPGSAQRIYMGRVDASQADPSGRFSASLELGLQRTSRALSTNVQTDLVTQPIRIPRTGLHVEFDYIAGAGSGDATVDYTIYAWSR